MLSMGERGNITCLPEGKVRPPWAVFLLELSTRFFT